MNKLALLAIAFIVSLAAVGCQSGLTYETEVREITIKTDPYNAKVYQINPVDKNEVFLGLSPVKNQPISVIKKFGGKIDQKTCDFMNTQVGMVNVRIVKEGFVPYIGNLATEKNEITNHRIDLEKTSK